MLKLKTRRGNPYLLLIIGIILSFVGAFWYYSNQQVIKNGQETIGYITGYQKSTGSKGKVSYFPIVKYTCFDEIYISKSPTSSSRKRFIIGEKVEIYCLGEKVLIKGNGYNTPSAVILMFGLIMIFLAFYEFKARKIATSNQEKPKNIITPKDINTQEYKIPEAGRRLK